MDMEKTLVIILLVLTSIFLCSFAILLIKENDVMFRITLIILFLMFGIAVIGSIHSIWVA